MNGKPELDKKEFWLLERLNKACEIAGHDVGLVLDKGQWTPDQIEPERNEDNRCTSIRREVVAKMDYSEFCRIAENLIRFGLASRQGWSTGGAYSITGKGIQHFRAAKNPDWVEKYTQLARHHWLIAHIWLLFTLIGSLSGVVALVLQLCTWIWG